MLPAGPAKAAVRRPPAAQADLGGDKKLHPPRHYPLNLSKAIPNGVKGVCDMNAVPAESLVSPAWVVRA